MAVEQTYQSNLAAPNTIPGHQDLETLAREDGSFAREVLRDAHYRGIAIAESRMRTAGIGFDNNIESIRVGVWGIGPSEDERKSSRQIILSSLGLASVMSAQLQTIDWQTNGAPTLTLPALNGAYNLLREHLIIGSAQYFERRPSLKAMTQYFLNETVTNDREQHRRAGLVVAYGLQIIDETMQEQFFESQMAELSTQIDAWDGQTGKR